MYEAVRGEEGSRIEGTPDGSSGSFALGGMVGGYFDCRFTTILCFLCSESFSRTSVMAV